MGKKNRKKRKSVAENNTLSKPHDCEIAKFLIAEAILRLADSIISLINKLTD